MSNLTDVTRVRSDPVEKQLWVKRAKGREMTLSEHLRDLANRDAEGTEPPKRPGRKRKSSSTAAVAAGDVGTAE